MKEKILEKEKKEEFFPKTLSSKEAGRILNNVLEACNMPPCKIPFAVLEERVQEKNGKAIREAERKEKAYG